MSAVELLAPIFDDVVRRNNFFNGRLLSAEDLRAEQDATRAQHRHLAGAAGDGVAWGLGVSILNADAKEPKVRVEAGLALNRGGDLLHLAQPAELTLVPATVATQAAKGLFVDCNIVETSAPLSGENAYVLTVAPASGYSGTALVSDPNATSLGRGSCGARFTVEGVRFRLVPIPLAELEGISSTDRATALDLLSRVGSNSASQLLRNQLAHLSFGTTALSAYFTDPLKQVNGESAWARWGLLDSMRQINALTNCDVPLALVVLSGAGIRFADEWSVRRRLFDARAIGEWSGVAGPRRLIEGEAAFLQFQAQLASLPVLRAPETIKASEYFAILPAAGWLPAGFAWKTFLGAHAPPDTTPVDASLIRGIIDQSWHDEPFAVATTPPVPLHVFRVPGESYVVFARSRRGAVRVLFTPAPAATALIEVISTAKSGATTKSTTREGSTVIVPDLAPGNQTISVVTTAYVAPSAKSVEVAGGRTVDVAFTLSELPNGWIVVSGVDKVTRASIGAGLISVVVTDEKGRSKTGENSKGIWTFHDLSDNASYTVTGIALDMQASRVSTSVARGTEKSVILEFTRESIDVEEPARCVNAGNQIALYTNGRIRLCLVLSATEFSRYFFDGFQQEGHALDRFGLPDRTDSMTDRADLRSVAPGGQILYSPVDAPWILRYMVGLQLNSLLQSWLVDWAWWITQQFASAYRAESQPMVYNPSSPPMIYFDPSFVFPTDKSRVPTSPPAYAVFGDFGIPLLVTPQEYIPAVTTLVDKNLALGLNQSSIDRLTRVDLQALDVLASSWTELVIDVLGDGSSMVGSSDPIKVGSAAGTRRVNEDDAVQLIGAATRELMDLLARENKLR